MKTAMLAAWERYLFAAIVAAGLSSPAMAQTTIGEMLTCPAWQYDHMYDPAKALAQEMYVFGYIEAAVYGWILDGSHDTSHYASLDQQRAAVTAYCRSAYAQKGVAGMLNQAAYIIAEQFYPTIANAKAQPYSTYSPPLGQGEDNLSRHGYYMNRSGDEVHQPTESLNGSIPSGASARCRDGDYSFSEHHSGTCSGHGGVAEWLR
jgi:hypothetical protein